MCSFPCLLVGFAVGAWIGAAVGFLGFALISINRRDPDPVERRAARDD